MKLDDERIALPFDSHALDAALHAPEDRLRGEHAPGAGARRARLGHALQVTLPHALPRHLDQAEVGDGERLRPRAIPTEVGTQLLQHALAIRLRVHVDEVADDDAPHVPQPELTRDLARRL